MSNKTNVGKISVGLIALALLALPKVSYADWRDHHEGQREERHYYRYHDHPHSGFHVSYIPEGCFTVWAGGAGYYYYDGLYYSRIGGDYVIVAPPIGAVVSVIPPDYQPVVINGMTYYVDNGTYYVYTRHGYQVVPAPMVAVVQPAPVVTKLGISDVIVLSQSGVSDDVIVNKIINTGSVFRLSTGEVDALRKEGVSIPVIDFMLTGKYVSVAPIVQPAAVGPQASAIPGPAVVQESPGNNAEDSFTINIPSDKGGYTPVTLKRSGKGFVGPQGEYYSEFPTVKQLKALYGK